MITYNIASKLDVPLIYFPKPPLAILSLTRGGGLRAPMRSRAVPPGATIVGWLGLRSQTNGDGNMTT